MSEFEVGDKVYYRGDDEDSGLGQVVKIDSENKIFNVLFEEDDYDEYWFDADELRKRTLAEKRADDARIIQEAADKLKTSESLSSGGRDYYGGDTVLKFIEELELPFGRANVVKYVSRAGKKSKDTEVQDLKKAADYLAREIEKLETA